MSKDVQSASKKLSEKRTAMAKSSSDSLRRSRQAAVNNLERAVLAAQRKVVDQEKTISTLQTKIDKEVAAEQRKRDVADAQGTRRRERHDRAVNEKLGSLAEATLTLDARLTEVESASLEALTQAIGNDPVQREHDVFLSYATPDEISAGNLRDELQARGLDVWMVDAHVGLGESLVTRIDRGIGSSRCGICLVTPADVDPVRFWPRQELAALIMGRKRVIPVISGLDFDDVSAFSSLLGDRKGLNTESHGLDEIAALIVESLGTQLRTE